MNSTSPESNAWQIVSQEGKSMISRNGDITITVHRLGMSVNAMFASGHLFFLPADRIMSVTTDKGDVVVLFRDDHGLPQEIKLPFGRRKDAERAQVQIFAAGLG